jgi:hypothetical protein
MLLNNVLVEQTQTVALIRWHAPKEGFVKINTDGACRLDQLAGCGGVIPGVAKVSGSEALRRMLGDVMHLCRNFGACLKA